ncbi:hypothetical protein L2E82_50228 [Cichorium intybus]|nr:hypothetical protein L2E82_50228 [Cichorium intybus]
MGVASNCSNSLGHFSSASGKGSMSAGGSLIRKKSSSFKRPSHSIRFKDVAFAAHGRLGKGKSLGSKDKAKSSVACSDSISSCDREVEKTIELGESLGFKLKDSRSSLRMIIEGEGDDNRAQ